MRQNNKIWNVFNLYNKYGNKGYIGENMSQYEHSAQAALQAEKYCKTKKLDFKIKNDLIIGAFLHVLYHILFTKIGSVGRWYFVVHLNASILSISLFLYYLKIFFEKNFFYKFIFKKTILYFLIIITLPLIFYNSIYLRKNIEYKHNVPYGNIEYKKKEPYAVMKFAEMLEKKNFDKSIKIFDSTDGNFAFFSKIPTYHKKGMAATPSYVFEKKKILKLFADDNPSLKNALNEFEKNFLIKNKIEYILINQPSKIHRSRKFKTDAENDLLEKCIQEVSEYNMIDSDEEFITYYYLMKTKSYLENIKTCKTL